MLLGNFIFIKTLVIAINIPIPLSETKYTHENSIVYGRRCSKIYKKNTYTKNTLSFISHTISLSNLIKISSAL